MTRPILICRPQPGADATAARAREMGMEALVYPLFTVAPIAWEAPDPASFDALMLTSANAARHGGAALARYRSLPVFTVGETTAKAAREAGFGAVIAAGPDARATLEQIADAGYRHVLHLCGEHRVPGERPGLDVVRRAVYRSAGSGDADGLAPLLDRQPVILVHSPRAGERIAELIAPPRRARLSLIAISPAACDAAGPGWKEAIAAHSPQDSAMLVLARPLCL